MKYLLDTNAVIAILKDKPVAVRSRFRQKHKESNSIFVSSIALFELWYGVYKSQQQGPNPERLRTFISGPVELLSFDDQDAVVAGQLRARLESGGTPLGAYDLLLAAQAVRIGATLVTANISEFARVEQLNWEDWSA